jgi:hypothetical protein
VVTVLVASLRILVVAALMGRTASPKICAAVRGRVMVAGINRTICIHSKTEEHEADKREGK